MDIESTCYGELLLTIVKKRQANKKIRIFNIEIA